MEAAEMSEKPLVVGSATAEEDVKEKFETEENAEVSPEEKMRGEIEALLEKTSGEIEKLEEEKQKRGIKEEGSDVEKKPLISGEEKEEKAPEEETWATLKEKEPEEPPKSPEVLPENITMEVSELYDPDGSPVEKESPSFLWQSEDQLWEEVPPVEGADDKDKEKPGDKKKDKKKTKEEKEKEKEKKKKEKEEKMKEKKAKDEKAKQEKKERDDKAKKEKKEKEEKAKKEKKEKDEKAKKEKKEKEEKAKKEKKEKDEKAATEKKEKDEQAAAAKKEKDAAAAAKKEKDQQAAKEKKEKDEKAKKEKEEKAAKEKKERDEKAAKEKIEKEEKAAKEKKEKEEKAAKAKQDKEEKLKQEKKEEEAKKKEQAEVKTKTVEEEKEKLMPEKEEKLEQEEEEAEKKEQTEVETKTVEEEKEKLMPEEKRVPTDPDAIEILAEEGLIPAERRRKRGGIWEENKNVIILGIVAFVLVVIITIAVAVPLTQGRPYRMEPYLNFSITTTWNSTPVAQPLNFSLESGERPGSTPTDPPIPGLTVNMDLPFYGIDPAPAGPAGQPFDQLWNYEVFEIFFLGPEDRYLEVEFGPYGHHLVLRLQGYRQLIETKLPLEYTARRTGSRWTGQAFIPWDYIPPQLGWMNAYGIHNTSDSERRYLALYPVPRDDLAASGQPDFHKLGYFKPLNVSVLYPAGWKQPLPQRWASNRPSLFQETPVQDTPVQDTPVQETPVQETPTQEAPVEQT